MAAKTKKTRIAKKTRKTPARASGGRAAARTAGRVAAGKIRIGEMLRKARESSGISQEELASRLKTKRTAISRIENHADDIKLSTLERVAHSLGKELKVKIG